MSSNFTNFEWYVGEDGWLHKPNMDVNIIHLNPTLLSQTERRAILGFIRAIFFCAVAFFMTGGASLTYRAYNFEAGRAIVANVLSIEKTAWQADDRELLGTIVDPIIAENWLPLWRKYWRGNIEQRRHFSLTLNHIDQYRFNTVVDEGGNGQNQREFLFAEFIDNRAPLDWWLVSPTRETRIYAQTSQPKTNSFVDAAWVRTVPPASYWGEPQSFQTTNISYEFYERDRALIQTMAPAIDEHYQQLFSLLELPLLEDERRFTIRITPEPRQGRGARSTTLYITSPLLATKPASLSDQEYVERYIVEQMTAFAVNRASNRRGIDSLQWSTVIWALRSQLEEALLDKPSPWFIQSEPTFIEYGAERLPITLDDITRIRRPKIDPDRRHIYWQQISAELVIKYAFETYGVHSAPTLIQEFSRSRNWEQLIPNVYGTSSDDFERRFNQFVAQRYAWD